MYIGLEEWRSEGVKDRSWRSGGEWESGRVGEWESACSMGDSIGLHRVGEWRSI